LMFANDTTPVKARFTPPGVDWRGMFKQNV
jgi:hypothetical protein